MDKEQWKNGTEVTLEWIWRIATVVIVPLLIWVAVTLRDVDQRLSAVEIKQEAVLEWRRARDREYAEHVAWGQERSEQLSVQIERLSNAVEALNQRLDRERTPD